MSSPPSIQTVTSLPATSSVGGPLYQYITGTPALYICTATNTLTQIGGSSAPTYPLAASADSAAAPSYSWLADPDTGIYNAAANTIGFAVGGTGALTLASSFLRPVSNGAIALGSSSLRWGLLWTTSGLRMLTGGGDNHTILGSTGGDGITYTTEALTGSFINIIQSYASLTAARTYTWPDAAGTVGIIGSNVRSVLQSDFVSTGNGAGAETDIRTITLAAARLATNGESISFEAASGTFAATASVNKRLKVYFGGTAIFDSGSLAITSAATWRLTCNVYRVSASIVRCTTILSSSATGALTALSQYTEVTGLTLANTQVFKITGNATNANDVTAEIWQVLFNPA